MAPRLHMVAEKEGASLEKEARAAHPSRAPLSLTVTAFPFLTPPGV